MLIYFYSRPVLQLSFDSDFPECGRPVGALCDTERSRGALIARFIKPVVISDSVGEPSTLPNEMNAF